MAWKNNKQLNLADGLVFKHSALEALDAVHELIDWSRIEGMLSGIHAKTKGQRAYHPIVGCFSKP